MKTKNIILLGSICFLALMFLSCDKYLDKKEDEPLTFDKIWTKREYIQQYYGVVWAHIKKDDDIEDGHPFIGASDDAQLSFNRGYTKMNNGTWSPSSVPYRFAKSGTNPERGMWLDQYRGIREANIFLANVDRSTAENLTKEDIARWKAEIRFARAYFYFLLVRMYGPVILVGDEIIDYQSADFDMPRNTLDECIEYIVDELTEIAESGLIPSNISPQDIENFGKPTKGTCLALIGRMKLYAARPLFNGASIYTSVVNKDGTPLFPSAPNPNKWREAADANRALITHSETNNNLYKLHDNGNPYTSYQEVFTSDWNSEIIFGRYGNRYDLSVLLIPAVVGGTAYGGTGPTQSMVDAYAMSNGRYPITGYNQGSPIIDASSGYSETGFSQFTHPIEGNKGSLNTYNMYVGREPRFYVSVLWSGGWWPYTGNKKNPVFAYDGNSGPGPRHDYPPTGYMTRKYIIPSANTSGGTWGTITWPVIRLAEIYLNYAEALNECDPTNSDIFTYINKVRTRVGLPDIETVYPEVANGADPNKMRDLIRRERQVELFFECHRYFDTRQWMIAEQVNGGPVYGMNIMAKVAKGESDITPDAFWQRTVSENRIFEPKHYLFPMHQDEIDRNPSLVQNYGW